MTTKVRIKVGGVEVDFEGPETFLSKKLPELISQLSALAKQVPASGGGGGGGGGGAPGDPGTLAAFLKAKKATSQKKRFLATAQWLHAKGSDRIKTGDVTKALRDNHQNKLNNASDCLSQNVSDGNCEKVGKEFFVTDDGRTTLG